jgi:hypothetical protein
MQPAFSPDGRWLAFSSDESGRTEVYVVPFPDVGSARWAVSMQGGSDPLWSRRGDELFYRDATDRIVSVSVKTAPTFSPGVSRVLFSASAYASYPGHRQFDVSPDGRRFVMLLPVQDTVRTRVVLVKNWFEELAAKTRPRR